NFEKNWQFRCFLDTPNNLGREHLTVENMNYRIPKTRRGKDVQHVTRKLQNVLVLLQHANKQNK
ncbi:hypothetical protein J6590_102076, partial [Homalodisca vitripennis]